MSTVMSLFNGPSELQGNLQNLQEISTKLMVFIKKMRNNLGCIEKQQDQINIKSKDAFREIDQEIECQFARLGKQYPPCSEVMIEPEQMVASNKISNSDKLLVKQTIKIKPKTKNTKRVINNSGRTIIPNYALNRGKVLFEPYSCYICLWQNKINEQQSCHWNNLQFYLNHLEKQHNLTPTFDILLFGCYNSLPFSHVKINGTYYNLFKNHPLEKYQYLINMAKANTKFNNGICDIGFCGCSIEQDKFELIDLGFFKNVEELNAHNLQKHNGIYQYNSSHNLGKSNHIIRAKKKTCINILKKENILVYFKQLEKIMVEFTKTHSIEDLMFESNPLNRLEVISRINAKWDDVFLPIASQEKEPTRSQILEYAKVVCFDMEKRVSIKGMIKEESMLVNTQINLLKSNVYICGQCERIFTKDCREFIVHVQSCQHYNKLNSHKLCFL